MVEAYWSLSPLDLSTSLHSSNTGLSSSEAEIRLRQSPITRPVSPLWKTTKLFAAQFKSPIIVLLLLAALLSFFLSDKADTIIILVIVFASGGLGFWQERGAANALQKLLAIVEISCKVLRDGTSVDLPAKQVVVGDVVILGAGNIIPADALMIDSKQLLVDEAALTGETFPVEKSVQTLPITTPLSKRQNSVFMGTHVVSGSAHVLVVHTGKDTELGKISRVLDAQPQETEFERGIRQFGYLLMEVTLLLIFLIFVINIFLARPALDSLLFSLALAVGLTPQLLPAIISVNLAHGAKRMAKDKVIVRRLASIENLGSMNILCSDKTGTITEGSVQLQSAVAVGGAQDSEVLQYAALNSFFQSSYVNPIDTAVLNYRSWDFSQYKKVDEIPYDFIRKKISVAVIQAQQTLLITKGAFLQVLDSCAFCKAATGRLEIGAMREAIISQYETFSAQGLRTLGVAYKEIVTTTLEQKDESQMTFLGFLLLHDPLQAGIAVTLERLRSLGIAVKLITGDNRLVATSIGRNAGLPCLEILTGDEIRLMSQQALVRRAPHVQVFAEVEPNQKERIILALKQTKNVVGYIGDGINDAAALHAADVGISVVNAVDVAKEASDIVLLEKDLAVLEKGVREGRITFANTLKYIFMATSANFGNMFSVAGASLFLPFLPLLPTQILLTNLLTDLPEITIATDNVDAELIDSPRRWDIHFIRRYMVTFGLVSSIFDYLTFGVLLWMLHANPIQFRTAWFVESVVSASFIVLVVRTRKPFFRSKPAVPLILGTLSVIIIAWLLPLSFLATTFEFTRLPWKFVPILLGIVALYVVAAEIAKSWFYAREERNFVHSRIALLTHHTKH